jgi:hypothetical protein
MIFGKMQLLQLNIKLKLILSFLIGSLYSAPLIFAQSDKQAESLKILIDCFQYNEAIKYADKFLTEDSTNSNILYYKGNSAKHYPFCLFCAPVHSLHAGH